MYLQSASSGVPLGAARIRALEWFLASMRQLMRLQVPFRYELLVTLRAHERPLACVSAHVRFQVACLRELFQTLLERAD